MSLDLANQQNIQDLSGELEQKSSTYSTINLVKLDSHKLCATYANDDAKETKTGAVRHEFDTR